MGLGRKRKKTEDADYGELDRTWRRNEVGVRHIICDNNCRYVTADPAESYHSATRFLCPLHGCLHVCAIGEETDDCRLAGEDHKSLRPFCVWTGRQKRMSYVHGWDQIEQVPGGIDHVRHNVPKHLQGCTSGTVMLSALRKLLDPLVRDEAAREFMQHARGGKLVRFGLPFFARSITVAVNRIVALGMIMSTMPVLQRMTRQQITRNVVLLIRSACNRVPGYELPYYPLWLYYVAPYGVVSDSSQT